MKLHLLFVACMTLFILSCGDNSSGKDKKDDDRTATLRVSNGNNSPECQQFGMYGMVIMNYRGREYMVDYNNQQFMQVLNQLYQQSVYIANGQNTTGTSGGYTNYYGGYTNYNGGYPNGGMYQSQYRHVGQDNCSVHYRMTFEGTASQVNNGGYGGYNQNMPQVMRINSFRIL